MDPHGTDRPSVGFLPDAEAASLPRREVAGRTYLIEGRIGGNRRSEVYRGAWADPLTERVVLKVGRGPESAAPMERELATLDMLRRSTANGTPFFTALLPEVVASTARASAKEPVTVFRYKNRYDWTLADVLKEYPEGVTPRTAVWMWKRTLTIIAWLRLNELTHAAIVPEHILIHPLNHSVTLLDWSSAVRTGTIATGAQAAHATFHPAEIAGGTPTTAQTDIAMSARSVIAVLGGDPAVGTMPASVPGPIADMLRLYARYDATGRRIADPLALEKEFGRIAEGVFGPPRYEPFRMPR
jgi:hypothetical protein